VTSLYEPWTCDVCTAGCTFEAMMWCRKRHEPDAECGHERDRPLACHHIDTGRSPDHEGAFDFVQLRSKA